MISNSLERIYQLLEEKIDDEFKKFISKHREKLLAKTQQNFQSEKMGPLKLSAWRTICSLYRLDPPFNHDLYLNLFHDCIDNLPAKLDEDILEKYSVPVEDLFYAVLHHSALLSNQAPAGDAAVIIEISWWDMFLHLIRRINEKILSSPPEQREM